MQLETLTLQTHHSSKIHIQQMYSQLAQSSEYANTEISVFYHQNTVLHVTWHLQHKSATNNDFSPQAASLIEQLGVFGPVHHSIWFPLPINTVNAQE